MKKVLRALGWVVFALSISAVGSVVYAAANGRLVWYFRVNGEVTLNGEKTSGYLHANTHRTILLITRTDRSRPETYLVTLQGLKTVVDCGEWHPIRFLPVPVGDVNPPCTVFTVDPARILDPPLNATIVSGRRSVEFSTASGKKVKADW
jgi:hypothetical protein